MTAEKIDDIIEVLRELCEDNTVPRNVKSRIDEIIKSLQKSGEASMKINKALHDLDEIGDDTNLQPYIRTQIWNISSMLERI